MTSQPSDGPRPRVPIPGMSPFFLNEASSDPAMTYFYGRLFAAEPEIRAMFPATMADQRRRFYQAICRIAAAPDIAAPGLPSPDAANPKLDEYLAALGRAHRKFGVRAEHYEAIKLALEATFERFPPDAPHWREENWRKALDHAAETMISAAEQEAANAPAWWTAEVIASERPVPHVAVLTIRTDRVFPYLPGQHVAVQTPRWPRVWRCYSIANAPDAGDRSGGDPSGGSTLTLHVRAVPGGLVSTALLHAAPGDQLIIGPAEGTMTPDPASDRDILCLAGGTGLAPVKAIAEAVARQGSAGGPTGERGQAMRKIALYFGARTEADLYDLPALRAMESHYPGLRVHTAISDVPASGAPNSPGTLNDTIPNLAVHAEWRDRDVYISGPTPMITRTVHRLRQLGAPAARLHYDLPS